MIHLGTDVLEAARRRLRFIYNEFENVYVAFSGGKDSGLLLNLCIEQWRSGAGRHRKLGVFHQDFEAQYTKTTEYVERAMGRDEDVIEPYWACLPMLCKTATSMYEQYWVPWDPSLEHLWVREMPDRRGVISLKTGARGFWRADMMQEDVYAEFLPWYHQEVGGGDGKTICLVGVRAEESLNRWRSVNTGKNTYRGLPWTTQVTERCYTACPLYDWGVEDVWTANARFGFDYNRIYDLFYDAGLTPHQMRVASPFNDWAIASLKLYRVLEPNIWGKMLGRVMGANFSSIYGGTQAVAWKNIKLPSGHTWKSYVEFLLKTLPDETRRTYEEKFRTSIEFWRSRGGVLSTETVDELRSLGIDCAVAGKTNYRTEKEAVRFDEYPDDADVKEFRTVPSYKRMAICILKNDHLCKYMGFSHTQKEAEARRAAVEKYMAF